MPVPRSDEAVDPILNNLISNVIKYTQQGQVILTASKHH